MHKATFSGATESKKMLNINKDLTSISWLMIRSQAVMLFVPDLYSQQRRTKERERKRDKEKLYTY